MQSAFLSGASASPPTMPASPSLGYPVPGNPGVSPATKPGAWWYHMMTQELLAVVSAAGLTPDQANLSQVLQALPAALASRPEMSRSLTTNGYQKLPGGFILQWGLSASIPQSGSAAITFPIAFPSACRGVYPTTFGQSSGTTLAFSVGSASVGTSGATLWNNGSNGPIVASWFAIGY